MSERMVLSKFFVGTALVVWAAAANAQSSVTLYGIVDNGLAYVNDEAPSIGAVGHAAVKAVSLARSGNRWGLRGVEDLGDGWQTIFTLENGFSADTGVLGQGGRLFGRQAFVGLQSDRLGTLTLGRQYDSTYDFLGPLVSWTQFGTDYGAHVGDNDGLFQTYRENNSVKYRSSDYAGFVLQGMYAFSNMAGGFATNRAYNFGLKYSNGPFSAAATLMNVDSPSAGQPGGSNPNGVVGGEYGSVGNLFYTSFVNRQRVIGLGARYVWGHATLDFVYTGTRLDYADGTHLQLDNYEANGIYQLTPSLSLGFGYIYTDGRADGGASIGKFATGNHPKWHQLDTGINYFLSKQTDLYAAGVYQRAAGDATVAALNVEGGVSGAGRDNVLMLITGIRHTF